MNSKVLDAISGTGRRAPWACRRSGGRRVGPGQAAVIVFVALATLASAGEGVAGAAARGSIARTAMAPTAPGAPTAVVAVGGRHQATVSWNAPPADGGAAVTGYLITPHIGAAALPPRSTDTRTTLVVDGLANGRAVTFTVAAQNEVGTGPASVASAVVVPPFGDPAAFVQRIYRGFFGRAATSSEVAATLGAFGDGASPAAFVAGLRRSTDASTNVDPTTRLYFATFLRVPDPAGLQYWVAKKRAGRSLQSIASSFVSSSEFVRRYGSLSNRRFVERVYLNVLGRSGDPAGISYWTGRLDRGTRTRGQVMVGFSESSEFKRKIGPSVDVAATWISLLGARPDPAAFATWVSDLTSGDQGLAALALALFDHLGLSAAPAFATALPGNSQATVRWWPPTPNGTPITGYVVTPVAAGTALASQTFDASTTSRTITGLANGVSHTFRIAAIDAVGVGPSAAAGPIIVGAPSAPVAPSASGGNRTATVSWTAPADNGAPLTGYVVTPVVGTVDQALQTFDATTTTRTITGLVNGDLVHFRVAAINGRGTGPETTTPTIHIGRPATAIAAGAFHSCALLDDTTVECWGWNIDGQLGDGTTDPHPTPVAVSGLTGVTQIAAGRNHTCALLAGGTVECWGSNRGGSLGDGTTTPRHLPTPVPDLAGVTAITAGNYHTCALLESGLVECWGLNEFGNLGDGSTDPSSTPTTVHDLTGVIAIAAGTGWSGSVMTEGWTHTCAVLGDGTAKCWGFNGSGELGDGTNTDRSSPVTVLGLTGATKIAVGLWHSCALVADGTERCWGDNHSGELGDGTTADRYTPVAVQGLTGVVAITGGSNRQSCALLSTGAARCWGSNDHGGLGNGSNDSSSTPVAVSGLSDLVQIETGDQHACALHVDGTVSCWGYNSDGQVGDGTTTDRSLPTPVAAL